MDEQAGDVQLSRHGAAPRPAISIAATGQTAKHSPQPVQSAALDLGRCHPPRRGAEADRAFGTGVAAALADDTAPGEAGVGDASDMGRRLARRAAAEQGAARERCAAGHARHSAGGPGGPATSWYIQTRKP